ARAEIEAIAGVTVAEVTDEPARGGLLVSVLVVLLFPAFLLWDVARLTGRGLVSLVDGLALRVRTIGTLLARAARCLATAAGRARPAAAHARRHTRACARGRA